MASSKEIRTKIKSVQGTRKITKAMEMVAAAKMRKVQERMRMARPYAAKIRNIAAHLARANPEYRHPFLIPREELRRVGIITVTTDKGLCGGLNTNVLRIVTIKLRELQAAGVEAQHTAIGTKGLVFMQRLGANIVSQVTQLGDRPHMDKLIGPVKVQLDAYGAGKVDAVYLAYTTFINTMKQEPVIEQLLPLPADRLVEEDAREYSWDYLYEPDPQSVLDELLVRYVETIVFQALAENMASEQAAKMVAMKAASDNAEKLIDDLQLTYNKARQASITQELSEIVGGAAAL